MVHERVARRKSSLYDSSMRRWSPILLLSCLAGCILGSGESSRVEKVPEDLQRPRVVVPRAPDRHLYGGISGLKPGQWATYREGGRTLTLSALAADGDALWIEVIDEGDPRQVSARLVGPDGVVRKAFYGELWKDGRKSSVEPQPLEQTDSPATTRLSETGRETGEEPVTISGRELRTRRVSLRFEDLEGRLTRDVSLWHPDVPPLYAGSQDGGLVKRTSGARTIELVAFGNDGKPQLDLPR
jgi:hypothetical protein